MEWLVQTFQNRILMGIVITHLGHGQGVAMLVPKVSFDGLALGGQLFVEVDGACDDVVTFWEFAAIG